MRGSFTGASYELDVLSFGERPQLDEGSLYLYVAGRLLPRPGTDRPRGAS